MNKYREAFFMHHGTGPWPCAGCNELLSVEDLYTSDKSNNPVVHHLNGNHLDNSGDNLMIAHFGCHIRLHQIGVPKPSLRGRKHAPEHVSKIRKGMKRAWAEGKFDATAKRGWPGDREKHQAVARKGWETRRRNIELGIPPKRRRKKKNK